MDYGVSCHWVSEKNPHRVIKGKSASPLFLNRILFILTGNNDINRNLDESEIRPDSTKGYRVRFAQAHPKFPVWDVRDPAGSVVEHPLRDREVVGSDPGRAIPKALKMVPVATLLGAQHYKASTGFSSPNKISHN